MVIRVTAGDATHEQVGHASVSRYIRRQPPGGIGAGLTSFGPLPDTVEPRSVWEAHDVPEVHYVLSGRGTILEEDEVTTLGPGDIVVTPAGQRHVLWAAGDEPLVTVYVAVGTDP